MIDNRRTAYSRLEQAGLTEEQLKKVKGSLFLHSNILVILVAKMDDGAFEVADDELADYLFTLM